MGKIRIVADYCARGFQVTEENTASDASAPNGPTLGGPALSEPPLSDALLQRLFDWNARYEDRCHPLAYEDVSGSRFDFVAFSAEGLDIARAVKRELPGWTVTYWDEALDWFLARDPRSYDPAKAEYEITLDDVFAGRVRDGARRR